MLFIDLDKFKLVNDTLGHEEGDAVLKDIAKLLRQVTRHGGDDDNELDFDLLARQDSKETDPARLGGDEFAIFASLMPNVDGKHDLSLTPEQRIQLFLNRLQEKFDDYKKTRPDLMALNFDMSVGAVLRDPGEPDNPDKPGESALDMLARSDNRMYAEKRQHHAANDASAA